jgi:hypothetical protein
MLDTPLLLFSFSGFTLTFYSGNENGKKFRSSHGWFFLHIISFYLESYFLLIIVSGVQAQAVALSSRRGEAAVS